MVSPSKLDFWIKNNYNILFHGRHGTGKSTVIIDAFNRAGLKWKYFSAATMDPWVDFVGVPKEKNGVLELIRPPEFQNDEIEALFFDEFNRGTKKVRNSVLELLQFKSINGRKFHNLRIIWAAINPEDDEDEKYDVDALDPAQADRFHIHVDMPYTPHLPYFKGLYGDDMALAAVEWWKDLPDNIKNKVSPRRLDYALDVYKKNGDLRDVLPKESNVSKLITGLSYGSISLKIKKLYLDKNIEEAKLFLSSENTYYSSIEDILKKKEYISFFLPLVDNEKMASLMSRHMDVVDFVLDNKDKYKQIILDTISANTNKKLVRYLRKKMGTEKKAKSEVFSFPPKDIWNCIINPMRKMLKVRGTSAERYHSVLFLGSMNIGDTNSRFKYFFDIKDYITADISYNDAIKTLEEISVFIRRSYSRTLSSYKSDIIGVINLCLEVLSKTVPDVRDITDRHPNTSRALEFGFSSNNHRNFYFEFVGKIAGTPF